MGSNTGQHLLRLTQHTWSQKNSLALLYNILYTQGMSLPNILLGLLETPASGYDLKRAFQESVHHFWRADLAQIYPTLHRLHRDKMVSVTTEPSPRGPDRKVYSRTATGTKALRRWLKGDPEPRPDRIDFLAHLFFVEQVGGESEIRRLLSHLRQTFADRLESLKAIDAFHRRDGAEYPPDLTADNAGSYFTLLCGIRRTEANVDWCDECIELLNRLKRDAPRASSTGRAGRSSKKKERKQ